MACSRGIENVVHELSVHQLHAGEVAGVEETNTTSARGSLAALNARRGVRRSLS